MTISQRIKEARTAKGHTRRDLAKAVGVSSAAITQWESGETKSVGAENLLKAAHFLKVRPDWLVFGTGEMNVSVIASDINVESMKEIIRLVKETQNHIPPADFSHLCIAIYEYLQSQNTPTEQQAAQIISLINIFGKTA